MSGCGGTWVRGIGTGDPFVLGMDPPLEVATTFVGDR